MIYDPMARARDLRERIFHIMTAEEQAEYLGGEMADTRSIIIRRCDVCGEDRKLVQHVLTDQTGKTDWPLLCDSGRMMTLDAADIAAPKAQGIDP